jgi:hypothetical protein
MMLVADLADGDAFGNCEVWRIIAIFIREMCRNMNTRVRSILRKAIAISVLIDFFCSRSAAAENGPVSGIYEIVSGTYIACCGIAGDLGSDLPSSSQTFVKLTVDVENNSASMAFLGQDMRTVFSQPICPAGSIDFSFDHGFVSGDRIIFHVDPGPPPGVYWSYTVSNSAGGLRIDGTVGQAQQLCVDAPDQFGHTNVMANLIPPPRIQITEFSKEGALLFIQGRAGWTDVVQGSSDLMNWTSIATNTMPATKCPQCPFVTVRDSASTNLAHRFYCCFEMPP